MTTTPEPVEHPCAVCGHELDQPVTCQRCRNRLRSQLLELPELYVYAAMSLTPDQRGAVGRGGTKVHAPLPLRLDVLSLLGPAARGGVRLSDDQDGQVPVLAVLEEWADLIAGEVCRRAPKPGARPQGPCHQARPNFNALLGVLIDHHAWACRQPFVADYAMEIRELHSRLRGIAQIDVRCHELPTACPRCELLTLVREDWSNYAAECRSCGMLLTTAEYRDVVDAQLAQHTPQDDCQTDVVADPCPA